MTQYLLDTNLYIMKKKPEGVIRRFGQLTLSSVAICAITPSELEYGVEKSALPAQNRYALARFLTPLEILCYEDEAAHSCGGIPAYLERPGTPSGALDMLITAHALSANCTLVANSEREFQRVPNLRVENWVA
ncbi:MAG: PIN domain-containing protein [Deferrisomatales bacterium]|nr:PIN domain-containing protein [Deferrisomatales bacterium]